MTNMNDFEKNQLANAVEETIERNASVIVLFSPKGGVGKSTTAINLAVHLAEEGKKVLLVDTDTQKTSKKFISKRAELNEAIKEENEKLRKEGKPEKPELVNPDSVECTIGLKTEVNKSKSKYDVIVIDTQGADSVITRQAILLADCIYNLYSYSGFDVAELERAVRTIADCKNNNPDVITLILPSKIKKSTSKVNKSMRDMATKIVADTLEEYGTTIEEENMFFLETTITDRSQYAGMSGGYTIFELAKRITLNPKLEYQSLFDETESILNSIFVEEEVA